MHTKNLITLKRYNKCLNSRLSDQLFQTLGCRKNIFKCTFLHNSLIQHSFQLVKKELQRLNSGYDPSCEAVAKIFLLVKG